MTSFYGEYRKKDVISDEEENRASRASVDKWVFRLLLVLIGFMPLIVMAHTEEVVSPLVSNISTLTSGIKGDLFTFYKSLLVLVITCIAGILLLIKVFFMNGKIRKTVLNYFLAILSVVIILSTILSPNISIALNGQYNRSDGAITWLCYVALMFIAMNIEYPKKVVQYVLYSLYPFVILNLIVISMNFYGHDVLQFEWVQKLFTLLLPEGNQLSEGSQLLGTLNHGNYMSGMFAIMALMFLTSALVEKNSATKISNYIISLFSILIILMSLSTSGFLTLTCLLLLVLWIAFRSNKKVASIALIAIFCIFTACSIHILATKNPKVWDESIGFFVSSNPYVVEDKQVYKNDSKLDISLFAGNTVYAADNSFVLPNLPESGVGAGSGRVYIWGYVLNLVKDRPLFGYGLDSLMYNFPHFNIDSRANLETQDVIVDKPHNMYVGILYGSGVFGFISFIGIILITLFSSFKVILQYKNSNGNIVILSIAWLAFLFQALFNDTLAGVAGPLWILLGFITGLLSRVQSVGKEY